MKKGKTKPQSGGCWYCHNDNEESKNKGMSDLFVSREFDCLIHEECIREVLEEDPDHPEATIFANEFGI